MRTSWATSLIVGANGALVMFVFDHSMVDRLMMVENFANCRSVDRLVSAHKALGWTGLDCEGEGG